MDGQDQAPFRYLFDTVLNERAEGRKEIFREIGGEGGALGGGRDGGGGDGG